MSAAAPPNQSRAVRLARRAWRALYTDSRRCIADADAALELALRRGDRQAQGWSLLTQGFHRIWYDTPGEAMQVLQQAQACFAETGDRAAQLLAQIGLARASWRAGAFRESLDSALALRDEGLRLLQRDERGMLLNTIAGCYSQLGQSQQAFAYMFQALREVSAGRGKGFDVMLYCNMGHELIQLGDYHQALSYVQEGLQRCDAMKNPRLDSVLRINRVITLSNLGRCADAMVDVRCLLQRPPEPGGRGRMNAHFEDLAIAALRAGDGALGAELLARAQSALHEHAVPDEAVMLQVASAELLLAGNQPQAAAASLRHCAALLGPGAAEGLSLRVRCQYLHSLAAVHERLGDAAAALSALRQWQALHTERALLASEARFQAAALHTEVLRMKNALLNSDARRRSTERAKAELQAANRQLLDKMAEVEALQQAMRQQATRDFLTGLFNRRHLDDVLPTMLAMARRDRQPLAVAIIDLDHFKLVNDSLGHLAGDRMLAAFGAMLLEQGRKSDVACRYGGEEFCLLMPRTTAAAARRKCMALLKAWSQQLAPVPISRTFSAGISDSACHAGDSRALLLAADEALLTAKQRGRNRVLVHDAPSSAAAA